VARSEGSSSPYVRLEVGLFGVCSQLRAVFGVESPEGLALTVKQRAPGDWIAVAKRSGPDGGPQVAFGSGYDLVGALLGLEGALAANRWREDRPWKPG